MKTNKIIISSVCAAIIVAAAAAGSFWLLRSEKKPQSKDFSGQTPEQIRAYLRSKNFNSLDEQTRRTIGRTARRQMMEYRVNEYFTLPADKRTVYLDKLIDEMEARRRERILRGEDPNAPFRFFDPNSRSNDPNERQRRRQMARSAESRRARMESIDPLTRAKRAAFREAMRARMQQRGISGPGPGGGRGQG